MRAYSPMSIHHCSQILTHHNSIPPSPKSHMSCNNTQNRDVREGGKGEIRLQEGIKGLPSNLTCKVEINATLNETEVILVWLTCSRTAVLLMRTLQRAAPDISAIKEKQMNKGREESLKGREVEI